MPETVNDLRAMLLSSATIVTSAVIDSMVRPWKPSKVFSPSMVPRNVSVSSEVDRVPVISICRSFEFPGSVKVVEKVPLKELTVSVGMKVDNELCLKGEGSCNLREPEGVGAGESSPEGAGESSPVGAGEPSTLGVGESSPVGTGESSPVGAGESSPVGAGESSPVGAGESSPVGAGESSPVGDVGSSKSGEGDLLGIGFRGGSGVGGLGGGGLGGNLYPGG